ncbi:MAG TPA: cell division protein FtsL [Thermoanaerobacterales bacterium]|nr:cell division protein FtsL [Thermoanaerobacterales bacterium]
MVVAENVAKRQWNRQGYEYDYKYYREPRKKTNPHKKGRLILALGIIAVVAIIILSRYSMITESQYRISKLKAELKDLTAQNERLRVEVADLSSVARIEDIARNKLNMKAPESRQIIYLNTN